MSDRRFSIIVDNFNRCLVCKTYLNIHKHEIFFGRGKRELSIKYGLVVPLCQKHHQGTNGVHGKNGHTLDIELKKLGQKAFERTHTREEFMSLFYKDYLVGEEDDE